MVQIDMGCIEYHVDLIKMVLKESGLSREQFYCSTRQTAKRIGMCCEPAESLLNWVIA